MGTAPSASRLVLQMAKQVGAHTFGLAERSPTCLARREGQAATLRAISLKTKAGLVRRTKRPPWVLLALLLAIWVALPLIPEGTGLRFGLGFRVFFSGALAFSTAFFWLLGRDRIAAPRSTAGVLGSIGLVYLATVGLLVGVATVSPQFGPPSTAEESGVVDAAKRGEALFWKPEMACFQCHTIAGRGGTRGPELTHVVATAGGRVAGLSAEQYLLEKVSAGATYAFKVPGYVPMMPPFGQNVPREQIQDVVAYLLTLK